MFKAVILVGLVAISSAQVLRYSPPVLGSTYPGEQQVIHLGKGGDYGTGHHSTYGGHGAYVAPKAVAYKSEPYGDKPAYKHVDTYADKPAYKHSDNYGAKPAYKPAYKHSDSYGYKPAYKHVDTYGAKPAYKHIETYGDKPAYKPAYKHVDTYADKPAYKHSDNYADKPAYKPAYKHADNYGDKPAYKHGDNYGYNHGDKYGDKYEPKPYGFSFESEDEYGTKLGRSESADSYGYVTGQYSLYDASGLGRLVTYTADQDGFRADVKTNEPGTLTSYPADVNVESSNYGESNYRN